MKLGSPTHSHRAFTLLEMMLVVAIIALIVGAGIGLLRGNLEFGQDTRVDADISTLSSQLKLYYATNGFYPSTEQGLAALVERPQAEPRPKQWRQLLDKVPVDPWQEPYEYLQPGKRNPRTFDVFSKGQDRKAGTDDDRGNWDTAP